jgi:hypothetical protein
MVDAELSPRTAICVDCRTALFSGEGCDVDGDHAVVSLRDDGGREALLCATWGPAEVRLGQARRASRVENLGMTIGVSGFAAGLVLAWVVSPAIGILTGLGSLAAMGMASYRPGDETYPVGARLALGDGGKRGPRGGVRGEPALLSPVAGLECVGYAVELRLLSRGEERVMYRDAVTCGFEIELDDGERARVPPGRVRLLGPLRQVVDFDNPGIERYLRGTEARGQAPPPWMSGDTSVPGERIPSLLDPLRYDVVAEATISPGDRVELASPFEPEVSGHEETGYRDPAPTVLTPRGVPVLRLLAPSA